MPLRTDDLASGAFGIALPTFQVKGSKKKKQQQLARLRFRNPIVFTSLLISTAVVAARADLPPDPIKRDKPDSESIHQHLRGMNEDPGDRIKIRPSSVEQGRLLRSPGASLSVDTAGHRSLLAASDLDDDCQAFGQLRNPANGKCSRGKEFGQVSVEDSAS